MKYKWEKKQRNGRAFLLLRVNVYSFYFPKKNNRWRNAFLANVKMAMTTYLPCDFGLRIKQQNATSKINLADVIFMWSKKNGERKLRAGKYPF